MKVQLTKEAFSLLKDTKLLAKIAAFTDIQYPTLYRWVNAKHESLTQYRVLYTLSKLSGIKVDNLVTVTE